MKKTAAKFGALLIVFSMMLSLTACSGDFMDRFDFLKETRATKSTDDDEDEDETKPAETATEPTETEPTEPEPTDPTPEPTPAEINEYQKYLIFPTEPYSYDKVHPEHKPGSITGEEAKELLKEIELDYLNEVINGNYVDTIILFDDYEAYGLSVDEVSWGKFEFDPEGDQEMIDRYINRLLELDFENLDEGDRIFFDKFLYDLEESAYAAQYPGFSFLTPVFNSLTSSQCEILFILDVITFETKEDAERYIELLADTDRYYDELCEFEEKRAELGYALTADSYEEIAKTFDSIVEQKDDCFLYDTFEERLDNIKDLSSADKEELIASHDQVMKEIFFPEFEECAERMRAIEPSETEYSVYNFEGGQEYYKMIARKLSNSNITPEEASDLVDEYFVETMETYVDLMLSAGVSGTDFTAGGTQENLDFLYGKIFEYFPEIPDHKYVFKDVPEVFQDSFSPAAYLGYHLDKMDSNMILINTAGSTDNFGTVIAHEAYPGHMYQSIYTRSICDHPYMYIFDSTGYSEGWAQYVEVNSPIFFGASEEELEFCKSESLLNALLLTMIDIGVGYKGWTLDDACKNINQLAGLPLLQPSDELKTVYNLVANDPGYAYKYGVGYIMMTKTLDEIMEADPSLTTKELHTLFLDAQPATYEQILNTVLNKIG